jgi:hypothetical protein
MFRFFKKRINTSTTSHEPLDGRTGHIGGIESLVLDDVRYFFGFSPNSDLVVSPLIADMEEMARFASRHMEQMDGLHDEAYWLQEASYAIEESELCSTPEERTFTSDALANFVAGLQQAVKTDSIVPGLSLESHLLYLLDAAGGWEAQNATDIHIETSRACTRLTGGITRPRRCRSWQLVNAVCRTQGGMKCSPLNAEGDLRFHPSSPSR